mgnify:CR=1 FL=1
MTTFQMALITANIFVAQSLAKETKGTAWLNGYAASWLVFAIVAKVFP